MERFYKCINIRYTVCSHNENVLRLTFLERPYDDIVDARFKKRNNFPITSRNLDILTFLEYTTKKNIQIILHENEMRMRMRMRMSFTHTRNLL